MNYTADGNISAAKETTAQNIKASVDAIPGEMSAVLRTILQAISAAGQKLILEQKAAMDETTYNSIGKSGNNYILTYPPVADSNSTQTTETNGIYGADLTIVGQAFTTGSAAISINSAKFLLKKYGSPTGNATAKIYAATGTVGTNAVGTGSALATSNTFDISTLTTSFTLVEFTFSSPPVLNSNTGYVIAVEYTGGDASNNLRTGISGNTHAGNWCYYSGSWTGNATYDLTFYLYTTTVSVSGTISSLSITKDANFGLRFWGDICANLAAGASGSTIKLKVCNSAGTPLHSNFVTVAANEYSRIPLERPVVLTATGNGQTVWNFTSLSYCDALLNELGVLAKSLLVEVALDGINYSVISEGTDFIEDISNILAPRITLISGTGVINGTTKLRAIYIVNIPPSNTTIKLKVQLNTITGGDTSPSIQPLVGDATKYVSGGQVAIV